METLFSSSDLEQLSKHEITTDKLQWQLKIFRKGISYIKLNRPAVPGDGILKVSKAEKEHLVKLYSSAKNISILKFVPASGAASRMFKALFEYIGKGRKENVPSDTVVAKFFNRLSSFAFFDELRNTADKKGVNLVSMLSDKQYVEILNLVLEEKGLNYGFLPKGLLKFHRYETSPRTSFEEHLVESVHYAGISGKPVRLHFTVSPEHLEAFRDLLKVVRNAYEKRFGIVYEVSFSVQKSSTDTIAVDLENRPFRNPDGTLLFRPAGHGALIDNLNELDADILFIKNIDNVVPEKYLDIPVLYKKILAGKLLEIREQIFSILQELDRTKPSTDRMKEIHDFVRKQLNYEIASPPDLSDLKNSIALFRRILNRPIRICGMVKNLGEPGGGPFWAPNSSGDITLQIIESSQVDTNDTSQADIFKQATHFNPVDLVCCTKSYKGEKFHLPDFVDQNTCFISQKSKDGKELKALELPGLWNGAMADWITLFIEVPVETFNPVKTVIDLLRPEHQ